MFDCREDSDALWHQFNVKLSGVLDVQLLEIIYRRENSASIRQPCAEYKRRSQRTDEVENLNGFRRCLELYVQDEELIKMKDKGKQVFKRDVDTTVWQKRPLSDELIQYCIVDTMGMFKLYEKMKEVNGGEKARLRVASERYADFYRSRINRYFDDYEMNAFLPLDIIPNKGTLGFAPANTKCIECNRRFPREEFSKTQLRNEDQKCRVCKEIKHRADVEQNRRDNWERRAFRYEYYRDHNDLYAGDSDDEYCFSTAWWI